MPRKAAFPVPSKMLGTRSCYRFPHFHKGFRDMAGVRLSNVPRLRCSGDPTSRNMASLVTARVRSSVLCKMQVHCLFVVGGLRGLCTWHAPSPWSLSITLWGNIYYHPLFPDEENRGSERLRNLPKVPQCQRSKGWDLFLGLILEPKPLITMTLELAKSINMNI